MRRHDCFSYSECLDWAARLNCDLACPCSEYHPIKVRPTWPEVRGCLRLLLLATLPENLMVNLKSDPDAFNEAILKIAVPVDDSVEHQVFL